MNKVLLSLIVIIVFSLTANAQRISENAIGLRLGNSSGFGTEVNYQRGIGDNNRLEFGLAWHSNNNVTNFKITGLYQWIWILDGNLNWYAGLGGGIGQTSFDNDFLPKNRDNEFFGFVAGDLGIEYNFDIPLLISVDFRPELGFGNFRNDIDFDIAFGIRYQF